ncbi:MAG: hypothetical protein ACRC2V_16240 [Xenococcaceae cyanobacterium]
MSEVDKLISETFIEGMLSGELEPCLQVLRTIASDPDVDLKTRYLAAATWQLKTYQYNRESYEYEMNDR